MAGRIQLVKSVIHNMLQHTMSIYSWPIFLLKDIERWIRNFIWSGDTEKKKMITVSWNKVCSHFDEGGLSIKALICPNETNNLKFCWDMIHSDESCGQLLRSRVLRRKSCISHHIFFPLYGAVLKMNSSLSLIIPLGFLEMVNILIFSRITSVESSLQITYKFQ